MDKASVRIWITCNMYSASKGGIQNAVFYWNLLVLIKAPQHGVYGVYNMQYAQYNRMNIILDKKTRLIK